MTTDKLFLSNHDSTPMYEQIMEQITAKVMAGDWRPGQSLPSIRELASASSVSVITVKRAYLELERAGVIVTRQGKGSFVAENQDLAKQLLREEFDMHLIGMVGAAQKLGMGKKEVVEHVGLAMAANVSDDASSPKADHSKNSTAASATRTLK
ncbi:GntR family transcriptional regulator [Undibacterium cyanobacteriorum]|uniref:GntR family transcriptional regulator n=1 Tax=Undibacterium cyanobacteriorum TaxID=3073561 RepID=A0ABY9RI66_9BURK|nr:GntR family transcriptional regulator [Undibacterium sp. 20NA77.5]WMW80909.1 GntR family transcriptional regulator [Undibacterium sp. 20NA77.5]